MPPLLIRKLIKKEAVNCSETSHGIELPRCNTYFCIDNKVNGWQLAAVTVARSLKMYPISWAKNDKVDRKTCYRF